MRVRQYRVLGHVTRLGACIVVAVIITTAPCPTAAQSAKYGRVIYVGNDEIDSYWDPLDPGDQLVSRSVFRDDTLIFETADVNQHYFRDRGLRRGTSHRYEVCAKILVALTHTPTFICGHRDDVTVGQVYGTLYWETTWSDPLYTLVGRVLVPEGSGLTVRGAEVVGSASLESAGGDIVVDQATLRYVSLHMRGSKSALTKSTMVSGSVWFERHNLSTAEITIAGNLFERPGRMGSCGPTGSLPERPCTGETGRLGFLTIGENAHATIVDNRFGPYDMSLHDRAEVVVGGGPSDADGSIEPASADIRDNQFLVPYTIAVAPYATAKIRYNRFSGRDPYGPSGLLLFGGSETIVERNIVRGFREGIAVWGPDTKAWVTGNTIAGNGTGLAFFHEPVVEAHDNCIAGNRPYGMDFECTRTVVQATANWWGSDSGPFYRWRNPAGTGDEVYQFGPKPSDVNGVLVEPWLMTPNCAIELVGDCDGDDQVTAGDLAKGIDIALATEDVGWCASMDAGGDGRVTVDELVTAANAASAATATAPE